MGALRRDNQPAVWFLDYIPQQMRGMAMDSGPLRAVPTRCLKIDLLLFFWCTGILYALQYYAQC